MKLSRKLLCLLLALAMVMTLTPAVAFAEEVTEEAETDQVEATVPAEEPDEEIPETGSVTVEIPFQINPLYEGLITEADLDIPEFPEVDPNQVQPQATTYLSIEDAGAQMRKQMKNRNETFTLYVKAESSIAQEVADAVLAVALEHTGVATEGDYIAWQFGGYGGQGSRSYNDTTQLYEYTLEFAAAYYTTADQEWVMNNAVTNLLYTLNVNNKTDYEKIYAVYNWLCKNVTYDYENLEDTTYLLKHTAYAALVNKTAVCQGYAVLFYRLMLELGVDARVIVGDGGGPHAWNIVELDGLYYNLDATWDAGQSEYIWFLNSFWDFGGHEREMQYDTMAFHNEYPMAAESYEPGKAATMDPYIYAGYCGTEENDYANAIWLLGRDGSLTITGTGSTLDYNSNKQRPYFLYWENDITKLVVDEGITRIGEYICYQLPNLTEVVTTGSLEEIGQYAFYRCPNLAKVTFSEGLKSIGQYAFRDCTAITTLNLPDSLTTIGQSAFYGLTGLTSLKVPSGLTETGAYVFCDCTALKEVVFPDNLTFVGESMFARCSALEKVHLPASLVTIESSAFLNCKALKNVEFPDSLKTIGSSAFDFCTSLESIDLPAQLETIGNGAFHGCRKVKSITFPANVKLGMNVLDLCTSLETVILPEGLTEIPQELFARCKALKTVVIPESVTVIQGYAFNECTALESIDLPDHLTTIGRYAFTKCTSLKSIVIPETVTELGEGAFNNCTSLKSANLPKSLTVIGEYTFYLAPLESIEIPDGVKSIGLNAFRGAMITELVIPEGVTKIDQNAFAQCTELTKVNLPESLYDLSGFGWCTKLTSISIPGNVRRIGVNAFNGCIGLDSIHLPNAVTEVSASAFEGCTGLKNVTMSMNVTDIDMDSFANCTALETIMIPATIEWIQYRAFSGCTQLKEIKFLGDAPNFQYDSFSGVTATAYYPEGNETWTEEVRGGYGGSITWVPYDNTCTEHNYEAFVTTATCHSGGYTTYTCANCGHSYVDDYTDPVPHSYENGRCKWCPRAEPYVKWSSISTSLGGNIAMNFYVELNYGLFTDSEAYIQFAFAGRTIQVPLSQGKPSDKNGVTVYQFSCPITSKNMTDEITAQIYDGDGKVGEPKSMSVDTYCNWVIANFKDEKTVNLMKGMLNYGASAQKLFNYRTDDLANATLAEEDKVFGAVDASAYKHSVVGTEDGIITKSMTLLLDSETTVRVYFELTGDKTIDQYTFTVDGVEVQPTFKDGKYYIERPNISAHRLDDMHVFTCGGITVTYGGLSYVNQVMTYYTEGTTFEMASALYAYSKAAEAYIG